MTDDPILNELQHHLRIVEQTVSESSPQIHRIADALSACFHGGQKLLLCGNGGSAADAQHVAGEFINRFRHDREGLPALALTTDTSVLTAIGNDSSFSQIFSRQVEALASPGDVLLAISTGGRSANVLAALRSARARGTTTVDLTGEDGRKSMAPLCDYCVVVPSTDTARIQECHAFILHVLCGMAEARFLELKRGRGRGAK